MISPMDAIVFSTRNGIDLMGLEKRGTIAAGNHADLLIVEGDPLADINRVADRKNHRMVVKNGVPARIRTDTAEHETQSPQTTCSALLQPRTRPFEFSQWSELSNAHQ